MKLRIGCGSDGRSAIAFFSNELLGMPIFHEPYPSMLQLRAIPTGLFRRVNYYVFPKNLKILIRK